jgi:predicted flap endonuclease-1-like 5' DNA nuclease
MTPQEIAAIRSRYYEALRNGASKEDAIKYANGGKAPIPSATPKPAPTDTRPVFERPPAPANAPTPASVGDDLSRIRGIGPATIKRLNGMGVHTYAQIAAWSNEEVERYDKLLGLRGRIIREDWAGQAKALVT